MASHRRSRRSSQDNAHSSCGSTRTPRGHIHRVDHEGDRTEIGSVRFDSLHFDHSPCSCRCRLCDAHAHSVRVGSRLLRWQFLIGALVRRGRGRVHHPLRPPGVVGEDRGSIRSSHVQATAREETRYEGRHGTGGASTSCVIRPVTRMTVIRRTDCLSLRCSLACSLCLSRLAFLSVHRVVRRPASASRELDDAAVEPNSVVSGTTQQTVSEARERQMTEWIRAGNAHADRMLTLHRPAHVRWVCTGVSRVSSQVRRLSSTVE
jgi:hypothetical protein